MRGAAAWDALQAAMQRNPPLCTGDDRFVVDELSPADEIECRELCNMCPLRAACAAFAQEGRPAGGFWAGRKRGNE